MYVSYLLRWKAHNVLHICNFVYMVDDSNMYIICQVNQLASEVGQLLRFTANTSVTMGDDLSLKCNKVHYVQNAPILQLQPRDYTNYNCKNRSIATGRNWLQFGHEHVATETDPDTVRCELVASQTDRVANGHNPIVPRTITIATVRVSVFSVKHTPILQLQHRLHWLHPGE